MLYLFHLVDIYYTRATQSVCAMHWLSGWEIGSVLTGERECMLTFRSELGRFLSCFSFILCVSVSLCLSCDDTMRHDTYLLRWRLQNTNH